VRLSQFRSSRSILPILCRSEVTVNSVHRRSALRRRPEATPGGHPEEANAGSIPRYGERYRSGEPISSSFLESAVNQS